MLEAIFGALFLLLSASVVLLFAMFGELNSRLPTERVQERTQDVWEADSSLDVRQPEYVPIELQPFVQRPSRG